MGLVAGIGAALDPQSLATLTAAAQNEAENNQLGPAAGTSSIFAPPPAWGSSSGGRGSVAGLLGQGEQPLTQNQIIAQQLQSALSRLSESISSGLQEFASLTWEGLFTDQLPGYGDSEPRQNGEPIFTPVGDSNIEIPGRPGEVLAPISIPGQVNGEYQGVQLTTSPMESPSGPTVIYQESESGSAANNPGTSVGNATINISGRAGTFELHGERYAVEVNPSGSTAATNVKDPRESVFALLNNLTGGAAVATFDVPKGKIYQATDSAGQTFTVRSFSSTSEQTGIPEWTLQGPRGSLPGSLREIKFRRQ